MVNLGFTKQEEAILDKPFASGHPQEGVKISMFNFEQKTLDLCHRCQDELKALFNNSIHARLLAGAKAVEDLAEELGDDHAAYLCGCSSSHIVDTLRHVEKHMDEDY